MNLGKKKEGLIMASRNKRYADEIMKIVSSKENIEGLRDELQEWLDSMPENLQSGQKAEDLDAAISDLDSCIDSLEEAEGVEVEFPGMFGG